MGWVLATLIVTASDVGHYGLRMWLQLVGQPVPSASLDLERYYRGYFTAPRTTVAGMTIPYKPTSGLLANWYYASYARFVERYSKQPGFAEFTGSEGRKLFFSASLDAPPERFAQWWRDVGAFEATAGASAVPIAPYNGNELRLSYKTSRPGYLIFVDNNDPDWRARVNGKLTTITPAFGTFKAVPVRPGTGTVTFHYAPWKYYIPMTVLGVAIAIAIIALERRRRARVTTSS